MTTEQRLDRLERIARLFVKATLNQRRNMRGLDEKLNLLVDKQIENEERFARNEERLARLSAHTDQKFVELAESQARTDLKLAELIDIIRKGRNGNPFAGNN